MKEKTYTTFQVADICGVRPTTIIKWANQNKIKVYTTLGGHRRVTHSDLIDFLTQNKLPIPEDLDYMNESKKILVISEDTAFGDQLSVALKQASSPLKVEWIQDGIQALLTLEKSSPDLIVLDVATPVIDGAHLLSTFRSDARTRKIKIIGLSNKEMSADKVKFMKDHADAFFYQSLNIDLLVKKTLELLKVKINKKSVALN